MAGWPEAGNKYRIVVLILGNLFFEGRFTRKAGCRLIDKVIAPPYSFIPVNLFFPKVARQSVPLQLISTAPLYLFIRSRK